MEEKSMMGMMSVVLIAVVMLTVVQGLTPTPPTKDYVCPICADAFYTYDELYSHFATAHPGEPIDIIWD